jgi:DNA-binding GntR family transcriptional regulator
MSAELPRLETRQDTLTQRAYDAIRAAIIDKTLPPGGAISETGLARTLGVSKTPVREAILRLREQRLIEGNGRAMAVITPSPSLVTEAYEARIALESQAAAFAADRATEDDQAELADLAARSMAACEAGSTVEFRRYDVQFHQRIARSAYSPLLTELAVNAIDLTDVLRRRDAPMTPVSLQCARDHVRAAELIAAGEADEVRALIAHHIQTVRERVISDYPEAVATV